MEEIPMRDFDFIASPARLLTPEITPDSDNKKEL